MSLKSATFKFLSVSDNNRDLSWYFDLTLITLIVLNVVAIILESVESIAIAYKAEFALFELVSVIFFSIEYILRVWSITEDPRYAHPVWGRLRYIFSVMALVDLLAILPFYAALSGRFTSVIDARFLRALRMFRLLRLFKIVRYVRALRIIVDVFRNKKEELLITSVRQDPAPGTHEIKYSCDIDDIEIKHTAKSRKGFALGAVLAAEYLKDRKGLHTMKDVLGL